MFRKDKPFLTRLKQQQQQQQQHGGQAGDMMAGKQLTSVKNK